MSEERSFARINRSICRADGERTRLKLERIVSPRFRTRLTVVPYNGRVGFDAVTIIDVCNMESKENNDGDVKERIFFYFSRSLSLSRLLLRSEIPSVYFFFFFSFSFCSAFFVDRKK